MEGVARRSEKREDSDRIPESDGDIFSARMSVALNGGKRITSHKLNFDDVDRRKV